MSNNVSILGGCGRIGTSVALDILTHTQDRVAMTRRANTSTIPRILQQFGDRVRYLSVQLSDYPSLLGAMLFQSGSANESAELVIHCAGPFRQQEPQVLNSTWQVTSRE